jgi:integrase
MVSVSLAGAVGAARPVAGLLAGYDAHVATLPLTASAAAGRRRAARELLSRHPDLQAWMVRPTPARLADLQRANGWPLLSWCMLSGWLRPDLELLLAKPGGVGLPRDWAAANEVEVARLAAAGLTLGWSQDWARQVFLLAACTLCLWVGKPPSRLDDADFLAAAVELDTLAVVSVSARQHARTRLFALAQACYQLGQLTRPPRPAGAVAHTPVELAAAVVQPEIRRELTRYATTLAATLRPATVSARVKAVLVLGDYLADHHPQLRRLGQLDRTAHIEPFLAWARHRPWRGPNGAGRTISLTQFHHDVVCLRVFFEDIACWGWASAPTRRLLFTSDIPRMPEPLPRALTPDVDRALSTAFTRLEDPMMHAALVLLRATGMRIGELLDLEVDCLLDFAGHGTWLKVPLGKLGTERTVPLDPDTLAVLDDWMARRGPQRALPHPRDGHPADFLFAERGCRLSSFRIREALSRAVRAAGLRTRDGGPLKVTPHQLRHTFGTSLINGGIGLPALMALLGHVTPEMTLRYAKLASPTVGAAYQRAMNTIRARQPLPIVAIGGTAVIPDRVEWLASEMLKTRVAHGYCSRTPAAGACPYANICEQCDNYVPAPDAAPMLQAQLDDVTALREDAQQRGWDDEAARHQRVATDLQRHLRRVTPNPAAATIE